MEHPTNKRGYASKLILSLRNLWSAREPLSLRNIRPAYLRYFFAFPLSMLFVNLQSLFLNENVRVFDLSATTVTFFAFAAGAIIMFAFASAKNIAVISKISSVITAAGFLPWVFLPSGYASLICASIFMAGLGGWVTTGSFSFVFVLNNAERFFASAFLVLLIGLAQWTAQFVPAPPIAYKGFAAAIVLTLCVCMYFVKKADFAGAGEKPRKRFDPSIWLVLFILFSYFAIRISGFYAPAFQHPSDARIYGIFAMAFLLCCILLQVIFQRSVWIMCCVFFLSSVMSHVAWYMGLPNAAYLLSELKEVGFLTTFYLLGCVTNKFLDFRMHKRLILLCMTLVGALYVGIDILHITLSSTQSIAVIVAAVLFTVFLLLSPSFSQRLFFADWSREFRLINMTSLADGALNANKGEPSRLPSLDNTNLSPREKQVVLLLLQGMTLRQVAPELGLTVSTVATYSKAIYKKLGINSRAELFLLFGRAPTPSPKE